MTGLTEEIARTAEAMLAGRPCSECGAVDWLAEGIRNDFVLLACDDCCSETLRLPLERVTSKP